jgi:hypothetical protein
VDGGIGPLELVGPWAGYRVSKKINTPRVELENSEHLSMHPIPIAAIRHIKNKTLPTFSIKNNISVTELIQNWQQSRRIMTEDQWPISNS